MKKDIYQEITDRIIEKLEAGIIPWRKPWVDGMPINYVSRNEYSGVNLLLLPQSGEWLTFLQAKQAGGGIKKGEKGTTIVKYGTYEKKDDNAADDEEREIKRYLKTYSVFHISQCEGIESKLPASGIINPDINPNEEAEKTLQAYVKREKIKLELLDDSQGAYYNPTRDLIRMPSREKFNSNADFYSVAFHESAHSTGHKSRLDRISKHAAFGSGEYSKEELVAEIAASYLNNVHGLETKSSFDNTAAYIRSWVKKFMDDKKMIVQAAAAAQKAANFILGKK